MTACITTTKEKDGIPYLNQKTLLHYVWHEFGHSFVNHLTEQYEKEITASKALFDPIREKMQQQAYSNWSTCVNEHIIRAILYDYMKFISDGIGPNSC